MAFFIKIQFHSEFNSFGERWFLQEMTFAFLIYPINIYMYDRFIDALFLTLLFALLFVSSYTVVEAGTKSKVTSCIFIKESIVEKNT